MQAGRTALHNAPSMLLKAAQRGHASTVNVLLEKGGVPVNVTDQVTIQ